MTIEIRNSMVGAMRPLLSVDPKDKSYCRQVLFQWPSTHDVGDLDVAMGDGSDGRVGDDWWPVSILETVPLGCLE